MPSPRLRTPRGAAGPARLFVDSGASSPKSTLFRAGVEPALRLLDRIDASSRVIVHFPGAENHAAARRWLARLTPRPVTYADAVSFAVMEVTGCSHVLGFDADFEAAGFVRWQLPPR